MTFLIDGHESIGPIRGLGSKAWGYTYKGPDDTIQALWSEKTRRVHVSVKAVQVELFDWMGNGGPVQSISGVLEVTIGPNPVYIKTASDASGR